MENKQLTAVKWLLDELGIDILNSKPAQQALELEKQQIMQAFAEGEGYNDVEANTHAQQYYFETYKKPTE
jgi:hypothetical protein